MRSRFTILLLLFSVRIFLGPVTFSLEGASSDHVEEAFSHIKLHKRRASFIDLQRTSSPLFCAPGCSFVIREAATQVPVPIVRRTIQPLAYSGVRAHAVPLPAIAPDAHSPRKEILLI